MKLHLILDSLIKLLLTNENKKNYSRILIAKKFHLFNLNIYISI
jgi:hypothetical protein